MALTDTLAPRSFWPRPLGDWSSTTASHVDSIAVLGLLGRSLAVHALRRRLGQSGILSADRGPPELHTHIGIGEARKCGAEPDQVAQQSRMTYPTLASQTSQDVLVLFRIERCRGPVDSAKNTIECHAPIHRHCRRLSDSHLPCERRRRSRHFGRGCGSRPMPA